MQVRVIKGGEQALNALLYKTPDQNVLNYLQQNISNAGAMLGNAGTAFINTTKALYEKANNSTVLNNAKALLYSMGNHLSQDAIYPISYDNIQNTNLAMQSYIMANPRVNELYRDGLVNGYEGTYYNTEPGVWGSDRSDYRHVMDGVLVPEVEGSVINHYSDSSEIELDRYDQFAILETWETVNRYIAEAIDPTDPELGDL